MSTATLSPKLSEAFLNLNRRLLLLSVPEMSAKLTIQKQTTLLPLIFGIRVKSQ